MKQPNVIAHRGGRDWAPENTLAAFKRSLELGVDGIEFDVQRCSTGELVVIHDEDVNRTTNGVGLVQDCSLPELKRLSAGLWFDPEFEDERVPLLSEVLELVDGKTELNIELKNAPIGYPDMEDDLLDCIEGYKNRESLLISSFDHQLMLSLHRKAPDLRIALLGAAIYVDLKETATAIGAKYFHPAFDCLRPDVVEQAHQADLIVNAWTLNNVPEWRAAIKMGIDGIVTDKPQALKEYLQGLQ